MSDGTIRTGVAGAGVFGGYHANKYAEAEGATLSAVYDRDEDRAKALAEKHGVAAFSEYGAFLSEVDALTIAAPATVHAELAGRALERGKHVLVEKPIAMSLDGADLVVAMAEEAGLVLQVGHQERYVADALGLLRRDPPLVVRSRRLNRFSGRAMDVSVVLDLMIHDLDLLAKLTGTDEAEVLSCEARREHGTEADEVLVRLKMAGGVEAALSASRLASDPTRDLLLSYPAGEVHLDFLTRRTDNSTPEPLAAALDDTNAPLALRDPLAYGTKGFLRAIREGTPPPVTGADGRAALKLALLVEEAAKEQLA
ncbi:Gfo/Idh/MocA family protein [Parvularcula dongshanensis]|uniref:Putative dehydrogenase n=1 Tax=Parvularcula dongshanensis TaxID=1173995 RepID=A0A840I3C0_9PROT|nr:Gfo/Idh/MocA family oxidoreductase [Parvularcula dongshanensis]MBB4658704.1 putative dehydrogenase [Parvularcula dongshanensis]